MKQPVQSQKKKATTLVYEQPRDVKRPRKKCKFASARLLNEPEFEGLLATWEAHSLQLDTKSGPMHSLLKETFPFLLKKYNYFDTDKKYTSANTCTRRATMRKADVGIVRTVKRKKPQTMQPSDAKRSKVEIVKMIPNALTAEADASLLEAVNFSRSRLRTN
ncbi:hypothetical protein TrLO_g381 [Triparma laevis f. longispina]|uniref:Uncharacterized protein n=1 Tax=Triparma laevis f. longispina TaxID=1714387 RepID=A0A9W7CE38_9STRA|nr:hypothetical protein TrLO_g381 [Triparma laevis f. longispina]